MRTPGPGEPPLAAPAPDEPVWLVRIVLLLVLVGFAAWIARQAWSVAH